MIKREAFSVNAERLKEIMAKETSADGTPKKSRIEEDTQIPQRQDVPEKIVGCPAKDRPYGFRYCGKRLKSMK